MEMFNNSADDDWTGYEEMHGDCYRGISLQTRRLIYERDMQIRKSGNFFRFVLWDKLNLKSRHRTRFLGLREYQLTDDSNLIDWSASARLSAGNNWDKLFVRVPEVKQDFDIFVIFDASASMFFGTQNKLKSEYAS
ncbi:MAG: DUF58 domain-containing protein, partial [archaeon]|nr:DUF58 domain-containing protein [archaeon]